MAKDDISVSIGVQGETKFKKALAECQNTVKQLDSALKANAAEYENNADALGENVEKTKLLKQSVELQKKMVEGLGDAIEYASKEYGEASRQTTQYVLAQNRAREAVAKLEKELKDSDRELEELGRDSVRVGRQLEQGIGDGAEDAVRSLNDMYSELQSGIDDIIGLMGLDLFGELASGAIEMGAAVYDFVEGTREGRRQLSYIEQNARSMGLPFEDIEDTLYHVASITGDIEGAYEGVNNLINTGLNAKEIADAADLLVSAAIKWPETMKFENMAEALQETVATKSAVGAYAEILERMGIELETVNKALEKTTTDDAAQDVALSFLANRGLEQHLAEYQVLNETMIASQEATYQLEAAWARLGGTVEKWVTPIVNGVATTVEAIDDILSGRAFQREREEQDKLTEIIEQETGLYSKLEGINLQIAELDRQGRYWEAAPLLKQRDEIRAQIAETMIAIEEAETMAEENGENVGEAVMTGMTESIEDETPALIDAVEAAVDGVNGAFDRVAVPDIAGAWESQINRLQAVPVPIGGGGVNTRETSSTSGVTINLGIDRVRFASVMAPTLDAINGREIALT